IRFAHEAQGVGQGPHERQYHFAEITNDNLHSRCIRSRKHKLIRNFRGFRPFDLPIDPDQFRELSGPYVELYDLENDPLESRNLAFDPQWAAVKADLDRKLYDHLTYVGDTVAHQPIVLPWYEKAATDFRESAAVARRS
ncbi:MAG: hypothetical protein KIS91_20240, partial [Anaerolineae bacterium]|nr:hypothetical protein [Anaerolineae bacterium]